MHELPGLSLREFIELNTGEKFSCFSLEGILENHVDIARSIVKKIKILGLLFKNFISGPAII